MKKLWLLSPFVLSLLASPLFADEEIDFSFESQEIAKHTLFGQQSSKKQMKADKNGCTTCCEPAMNYRLPADFWGVDTYVEYLLWQVQEQASYFVANNTPSPVDNNYPLSYILGTFQSAAFDWSSGVRAGFGYSFGRDVWQLQGQYTWYKTDGQSSYSVPTPLASVAGPTASQYLMSTRLDFSAPSGTAQASSSTSFSYQMADLLLASAFLATDQIEFNYSFGATGGYIKENWNITYVGASTPVAVGTTYHRNDWKFGGGGFRAGLDTNWHMGYGFGFFGKVSFAAILGQYTNHELISLQISPLVSDSGQYGNSTYQGIMLLPTSQFIIGFDWTRAFSNCWISALKVSVAGEFNHLSNLQQVFGTAFDGVVTAPNLDRPTARDVGSVYMYGGTAHFGADF